MENTHIAVQTDNFSVGEQYQWLAECDSDGAVVTFTGKVRNHNLPGDEIVFVGVTSAHRNAAFQAAEFIMDYLKTKAPFWKKETLPENERWVEAKESDETSANRW